MQVQVGFLFGSMAQFRSVFDFRASQTPTAASPAPLAFSSGQFHVVHQAPHVGLENMERLNPARALSSAECVLVSRTLREPKRVSSLQGGLLLSRIIESQIVWVEGTFKAPPVPP